MMIDFIIKLGSNLVTPYYSYALWLWIFPYCLKTALILWIWIYFLWWPKRNQRATILQFAISVWNNKCDCILWVVGCRYWLPICLSARALMWPGGAGVLASLLLAGGEGGKALPPLAGFKVVVNSTEPGQKLSPSHPNQIACHHIFGPAPPSRHCEHAPPFWPDPPSTLSSPLIPSLSS